MKPTIGFIGLGIMGKPMSTNLINADYTLVVHNRSRQAVKEMALLGAKEAFSGREVASQSEVVITMLPDSPDVEAVALGPDGVLEGLRPGGLYIDMSTIAPTVSKKIAEIGAQRGVAVLDAPVSGGDVGARNATLSIMVGGSQEAFDRALPIFQVLGKNIVLCGESGAGQTVKACNQIMVALQLEAMGEALVLGMKAGVDPTKVVQVLSGGLARCGVLENRGLRVVNRDFQPGFRVRLHYKDLGIALATARAYDVPLPVTSLVHEMFKALRLRGRGELDHSAIVTYLEDLAQVEVKVPE